MVMPLSSPASSSSEEAPSTKSGDFFGSSSRPVCASFSARERSASAQRALVAQPLHHREPDVLERHAGKLGVQIVRRLPKILRIDLLADVDRLARNLSAVCDDDDQHFGGAQRNEFDFFEDAVGRHRQRKRDEPRRAREHLRDRGQDIFRQRRRAGVAPQLGLDRRAAAHRARCGEQLIDVEAVPAIGRDAAGGRMGLLQVSEIFELGERVADGGRRHTQAGHVHQARGSDRLAGIDIFGNERGENLRRSG